VTIRAQPITSAQNPRFRHAQRLRQRRGRKRQERILIDGQREIACALAGGARLLELFLPAPGPAGEGADDQLLREAVTRGAEVFALPAPLLERISYGGRSDQWVATADVPQRTLAELQLPPQPLLAILERVEKPGNLGAVVRSADGAGVDAVIVADGGTDLFNPNAIRASRGTIFTLPVCAADASELQAWLDGQNVNVCVARVDAAVDYDAYDFRQGSALILGSEALGVSARWLDPRYIGLRLPMRGRADSLNLSAAAAILFYEANRQRRQAGR
jgi:TrmH family RNA methyltransferase